jgi:hypothetical protein
MRHEFYAQKRDFASLVSHRGYPSLRLGNAQKQLLRNGPKPEPTKVGLPLSQILLANSKSQFVMALRQR